MRIPFLNKVYRRIDFDRALVFKFFTVFSLFEYALKQAGFLMNRDDAQANWEEFASKIHLQFDPQATPALANAVQYMLTHPVMKQAVDNGAIYFIPRQRPPNMNDTVWLSVLIRGVRNNLFHGGKFRYDRPRDPDLIKNSLIILEAWAHCNSQVELALNTIH